MGKGSMKLLSGLKLDET